MGLWGAAPLRGLIHKKFASGGNFEDCLSNTKIISYKKAAREVAVEFVQMLAVEKWPATGLAPEFLAEAMIANGAGMLAATERGPETAERLRDLADALERA